MAHNRRYRETYVHITWSSVRLALRLGFWPRYGQQKSAFIECFHIVFKTALKRQKVTWIQILQTVFRKMHPDLPAKCVDGDWPFRTMMAHIASRLHPDENNAELFIFDQRFGASAGFPLP